MKILQPKRSVGAFDVKPSACKYGNLPVSLILQVMIGSPKPNILQVQTRCQGRDMHRHVSSNTRPVDFGISRGDGTVGELKLRASKTTDACMHIPHSRRSTAGGGCQIPLNENGSGLGALRADYHIRPLHPPYRSLIADFNDWPRSVHVVEEIAAGHDDGVSLSDDSGTGRNY